MLETPTRSYSTSNQILPPSCPQMSDFEFGKFSVEIGTQELQGYEVTHISFNFYGQDSYDTFVPIAHLQSSSKSRFLHVFSIRTTLWHFYLYLKDAQEFKVKLKVRKVSSDLQDSKRSHDFPSSEEKIISCCKSLKLSPPENIFQKTAVKANLITNPVELCDITNENQQGKQVVESQNFGGMFVMLKLKLQFDEALHQEVSHLIDFQELLVNPQEEEQQPHTMIKNNQSPSTQFGHLLNKNKENNQNRNNFSNFSLQKSNQLEEPESAEQHSKLMIEDDIDRMISEMQQSTKKYDISRYLDCQSIRDHSGIVHGEKNQQQQGFLSMTTTDLNADKLHPYHSQKEMASTGFPGFRPYNESLKGNSRENNLINNHSSLNQFSRCSNERAASRSGNRSNLNNGMYHSTSATNIGHNYRPPLPTAYHQSSQQIAMPLPPPNDMMTPNMMNTSSNLSQRSRSPYHQNSSGRSPYTNRHQGRHNMSPYRGHSTSSLSLSRTASNYVQKLPNNNSIGEGNLKIHLCEMMVVSQAQQEYDLGSFFWTMRLFVNDEQSEVMNCVGRVEGEVVVFDNKFSLKEINLTEIQFIRFQLSIQSNDCWQDSRSSSRISNALKKKQLKLYDSIFTIDRLVAIPKMEGTFMINFKPLVSDSQIHGRNQFHGSVLSVSESNLRPLAQIPKQHTLRIHVSFSEEMQTVQTYLKISQVKTRYHQKEDREQKNKSQRSSVLTDITISKCKYKIPFTKETVQFDTEGALLNNIGHLQHFNIFPHSKNNSKIILQFWGWEVSSKVAKEKDEDDVDNRGEKILGIFEINMSNIRNINRALLETNIEPIYLYDSVVQMKKIFETVSDNQENSIRNTLNSGQQKFGQFKLTVCCGTVKQVQHVLNKNMAQMMRKDGEQFFDAKKNQRSQLRPTEVDYSESLGVYVKERKQNEIEEEKTSDPHKGASEDFKNITEGADSKVQDSAICGENQFLPSSKLLEMGLQQQQEDEDQESESESAHEYATKNRGSVTIDGQSEKCSSAQKPSLKQTERVSKDNENYPQPAPVEQPKPAVLKSLTETITKQIESYLSPLISDSSLIAQLKTKCKPYLLFNFIEIQPLCKQFSHLGISKQQIINIVDCLQPQNEMVNFNLLLDYICSIEMNSCIKAHIVPEKLSVNMMQEMFYEMACEEVYSRDDHKSNWGRDGKQGSVGCEEYFDRWLSDDFVMGNVTALRPDQDFAEMRKMWANFGFKLSMAEYNIIKARLEEVEKEYLAMKHSSGYQIDPFERLKIQFIEEIVQKKKEQKLNQQYEQEILKGIYGNESYELEKKMTKQFRHGSSELRGKQEDNSNDKKVMSQNQELSELVEDEECDDDFIIGRLNSNKGSGESKDELVQEKESEWKQDFKGTISQQQRIQEKCFKSQEKTLIQQPRSAKRTEQTLKITVDGLQNCQSTYECQMDEDSESSLRNPFFKVVITQPFQQNIYFKSSDKESTQVFKYTNPQSEAMDESNEQIEGEVQLKDISPKDGQQVCVSKARFMVIKSIKSVYALKTISGGTFCGLVHILIEDC